jgi:hypothetical protein
VGVDESRGNDEGARDAVTGEHSDKPVAGDHEVDLDDAEGNQLEGTEEAQDVN